MLGDRKILVQRFYDILAGKRTWSDELSRLNVVYSLPDVEQDDIILVMPYRGMMNVISFMKAMDEIVSSFAGY